MEIIKIKCHTTVKVLHNGEFKTVNHISEGRSLVEVKEQRSIFEESIVSSYPQTVVNINDCKKVMDRVLTIHQKTNAAGSTVALKFHVWLNEYHIIVNDELYDSDCSIDCILDLYNSLIKK